MAAAEEKPLDLSEEYIAEYQNRLAKAHDDNIKLTLQNRVLVARLKESEENRALLEQENERIAKQVMGAHETFPAAYTEGD